MIFYYRWKTQKIESSLRFKRNPKYYTSTWGLDSRAFENNKANLKTRQIHQVATQTHNAWIMKSLKKLHITSISRPLQ